MIAAMGANLRVRISPMSNLSFQQICDLEPQVQALFAEAKAIQDDPSKESFCANNVWYGHTGLKSRVAALVGDRATNPQLRTSQAYDMAYHTVYDVLPPCRNCGCL
jgi:hypothetical protein